MLIFLFTTSLAVSLDSFFVGLGLGAYNKFTIKLPALVAIVTFLLCLITCILGEMLQDLLNNWVSYIGCALLVCVGLINFFKTTDSSVPPQSTNFYSCFAAAVGVGLDAAVANFSLSLMGYTSLLIPLLFAATHFATVIGGVMLANSKYLSNIKNTNKFAGVLLVMLGIIKLI